MSILVLAHAFTTVESEWAGLCETAVAHGVPLTMRGLGQPCPWDAGFPDLVNYLRHREEPYMLMTDAFDVLVSHWDPAEVISLIDAEPSGVIQSCETDCWPPGPWCDAYRHETPWYACNGGQVCGRTQAVADMLEVNYRDYRSEHGGGNQERLHKMIAAGYPIGLDTRCQVFQSMSGAASGYVELRDGKLFNSLTGTWPMFGHWNGRTPGMEIWRKLLNAGI